MATTLISSGNRRFVDRFCRKSWCGRARCSIPRSSAAREGFLRKLNPVTLVKNPVIFVVEVGAALTTVFLVRDIFIGAHGIGFQLQIALWLWFTVLFANFAEAMAEARGKAQADTLRKTKTDALANASGRRKIEKVPGSSFAPAIASSATPAISSPAMAK